MKGIAIALGVGTVVALLPVWRGAGHSRHDGVNLFRLAFDSFEGAVVDGVRFGHPHYRYDEAVFRARQAWELRNAG